MVHNPKSLLLNCTATLVLILYVLTLPAPAFAQQDPEPIPDHLAAPPIPVPTPDQQPPPVPIAVPTNATLTKQYKLSPSGRGIVSAVQRKIITMRSDIRRKLKHADTVFSRNEIEEYLKQAYTNSGATPSGRINRTGNSASSLQLFSADPQRPPVNTTRSDGQYYNQDIAVLLNQWTAARQHYIEFEQALQRVEINYPERVSSSLWLWQFDVPPDSLINNKGEIELSREHRRQLFFENSYLQRLKTQWDIWEERLRLSLMPRHLSALSASLAQKTLAWQLANGVADFWDQKLRYWHPLYINAMPDDQQQLAAEISQDYGRTLKPFQRYQDCALKYESFIYRNGFWLSNVINPLPLSLPTTVNGERILQPYHPAFLAKHLSEAPRFDAACALPSPAELLEISELLARLGGEPQRPSDIIEDIGCPQCDELRIELRALEQTLYDEELERRQLENELIDGPDAMHLQKIFEQQWQRLEQQISSALATSQINREGLSDPSNVSTSTLFDELIPDDIELRKYLSINYPISLLLALSGNESAKQRICKEIRAYNIDRAEQVTYSAAPRCNDTSGKAAQSAVDELLENVNLDITGLTPFIDQLRETEAAYLRRSTLEYRLEQLLRSIQSLKQEIEDKRREVQRCIQACR